MARNALTPSAVIIAALGQTLIIALQVQLRVETAGSRGQQRLFNQPKTKRRLRRQMARQLQTGIRQFWNRPPVAR
ncbi:hypothetical protein MJ560_13005 [Klebsiella pneumoniae]|nr:hypothetical protein MJ560_13005 [Klebsiella pneumoniae]